MNTVAFVHVGEEHILPSAMVASVRCAMPRVRVVHLTDEQTAPIAGVDEVVRRPYDGVHLMTYRLMHFAQLDPCDAVFLDTDIIVQNDFAALWALDFDVALTRRDEAIPDPNGQNISAIMPYNTGVMASRSSGWDFWRNAWRYCESLTEEHRRWWGDQLAVHAIAKICPLSLRELPCALYNYTPATAVEDVSHCLAVHYKGKRKAWMISRAQAEFGMLPGECGAKK